MYVSADSGLFTLVFNSVTWNIKIPYCVFKLKPYTYIIKSLKV